MEDVPELFDPRVVAGKHVPWCDSQIGPEFKSEQGVLHMTLTICTGCLPVS